MRYPRGVGTSDERVWELPGYILLERIALGGRGEVYLAREGDTNGPLVAVKVLRPEDASRRDRVQAFLDEVRISSLLVHPNIVRVYYGDIHDGLPYLVMEHVDGLTLWDVNERARMVDKELPHDLNAYMVAKVAEALDYAHSLTNAEGQPLNLVHRDVSAVNVMVTFDGALKLLDFGIARSTLRSQSTAPGIIKGKLDYLSPEQCEGGTIDAVTDIYSLGVLLFELVTGTRPFVETDVATLFRMVSRGERPAVRNLRPDVPPKLEKIIDQAMATKRDRRYASAAAMLEDLRAFLRTVPQPPTSTSVSLLLTELAPDKVRQIADTYGPPETTAISRTPDVHDDHFEDDLEGPTIAEYSPGSALASFDEEGEATQIDTPRHRRSGALSDAATMVEDSPLSMVDRGTPPPAKNRTVLIVLAIFALFSLATLTGVVVTLSLRDDPQEGTSGPSEPLTPDANPTPARPATPEPPQPTPPEHVAPATGQLELTLSPGDAEVTVAGTTHNTTDGRLSLTLPIGSHELRASAPGHSHLQRAVDITEGEATTLEINLEPSSGRLTVRSRRRAMVYIGGRRIELTPLEDLELEPGLYVVRVSNRYGARRRRVRIEAGEEEEIEFDL